MDHLSILRSGLSHSEAYAFLRLKQKTLFMRERTHFDQNYCAPIKSVGRLPSSPTLEFFREWIAA
jgi:hypothetical protein